MRLAMIRITGYANAGPKAHVHRRRDHEADTGIHRHRPRRRSNKLASCSSGTACLFHDCSLVLLRSIPYTLTASKWPYRIKPASEASFWLLPDSTTYKLIADRARQNAVSASCPRTYRETLVYEMLPVSFHIGGVEVAGLAGVGGDI